MTRQYLIDHLIEQGCHRVEGDNNEIAEGWQNCINAEFCYVPHIEYFDLNTYCHVFYELRVDPPNENGYDSDYDVYLGFRNHRDKLIEQQEKR